MKVYTYAPIWRGPAGGGVGETNLDLEERREA